MGPEVFPEAERSRYRRCVCTLIQGELNQKCFCPPGAAGEKFADASPTTTNDDKLPFLEALTCGDSSRNVPFYSLSMLIPFNVDTTAKVKAYVKNAIDTKTTVFKIFSPNLLEESILEEMFLSYDKIKSDASKIHIDDWLAYPHYEIPQKLGKFVLDEDEGSSLLYIEAIECSAGAMEMSMIGGKNVSNIAAAWI